MVTENDVVGQVQMPVSITRQDMEDIMACAFEGGVNYWCNTIDYNAGQRAKCGELGFYAPKGFEIVLHDTEDDSEFETHLTEATLLAGIQKWATWMEERGQNVDFNDIDADAADLIFQFAVLGEITFA